MKRIVLSLAVLTASACLAPVDPSGPSASSQGGLLSSMGFALTDDGDPGTPAGTLTAEFQAPVIGVDEELTTLGTAHVAFDDVARDIASATIMDAYPSTDIVYVVLFQTDAPWRYVIVAAHGTDIVDGSVIAFDGENAAAIVVDEATGSGFLATTGALTVITANLASGGSLAGSVQADLSEVALATWPEGLFPLTATGGEGGEQYLHASASGSFSASYTAQPFDGNVLPAALGTADITVVVEGRPPFHGVRATAGTIEPGYRMVIIEDDTSENVFILMAADASFVAGSTVSLDGFNTGAWLLSSDGSQLAFTTGTLQFDSVSLADGGLVAGSFNSDGDAWFLPADGFSGGGDWEEPPSDACVALQDTALAFVPTSASVGAISDIDGFDRVLNFSDDGTGTGLAILLAPSASLESGATLTYDLSAEVAGGAGVALFYFASGACEQPVFVDGGTLTATSAGGYIFGTITYSASGQTRDVTFDLPLSDAGPSGPSGP